jgi:predicted secreted protein
VNWLSGIFIYAIIWMLALFVVLPLGVKIPDKVEPGHATSAPSNPRMWWRAGVTTVISGVIWVVVYFVMKWNLIPLH